MGAGIVRLGRQLDNLELNEDEKRHRYLKRRILISQVEELALLGVRQVTTSKVRSMVTGWHKSAQPSLSDSRGGSFTI